MMSRRLSRMSRGHFPPPAHRPQLRSKEYKLQSKEIQLHRKEAIRVVTLQICELRYKGIKLRRKKTKLRTNPTTALYFKALSGDLSRGLSVGFVWSKGRSLSGQQLLDKPLQCKIIVRNCPVFAFSGNGLSGVCPFFFYAWFFFVVEYSTTIVLLK